MSIRFPLTHRGKVVLAAAAVAVLALFANLAVSQSPEPASANYATGFAGVSAGLNDTCALMQDQSVTCWGANAEGQLGNGSVYTGPQSCATFTSLGCSNIPAAVSDLSGVATVTEGLVHTCALTSAGSVKCWGSNYFGRLGIGTYSGPEQCEITYGADCSTVPVDVVGLGSGVVAIDAGYETTCAVMADGALKCWGNNNWGQAGTNCVPSCHTPTDVPGISNAAAVSVGDGFTCALTSAGGVKCWGYNNDGEMGNGTISYSNPNPVDVTGLTSGVAAIAAGGSHVCAITTAGAAKCWGRNMEGQLGATGVGGLSSTPVQVAGLASGVTSISGGLNHTCALTTAGGVKCWGASDYGQLGNGSTASQSTPADAGGLTSGVAAISTGRSHTCAVQTSGNMVCWGYDGFGQLGDGTFGVDPYCRCNMMPLPVVETTAKPTPTFTPCPTGGCPTPTPVPTPSSDGLDFSIGTDLLSGAGGACDSSGAPTNVCNVPAGAKFNLSVLLNSLPPAIGGGGYQGFQFYLSYTNLTATETKQGVHPFDWPDCVLVGLNFQPGVEQVGCAIGLGALPSTFTGRMAAPEFTCTADGVITLVHGAGSTSIVDNSLFEFSEANDESLTVHCVAPQAYPGDTDADGCPDAREQGISMMMGGRRNFLNPWDWFDPTGDHMARIDDALAVASRYGKNVGDAAYDVKYDRTYIGPNAWNLGPPNGQVRIDDVLTSLRQYGAGCSAS